MPRVSLPTHPRLEDHPKETMSSSSSPRKEVRFADSPNELYNYDSDSAPSPVNSRPPPFTFPPNIHGSPNSPYAFYNSRSLNETPSPVYNPIALPSSPIHDYGQRNVAQLSPIRTTYGLSQPGFVPSHARNDSASSSSSYQPVDLPATPNLRPVELPPVDVSSYTTPPREEPSPLRLTIHPSLLYGGGIDVDLASGNLDHFIASLPLECAVTPPRPVMILRSTMLPWKVHVEMPAKDLEVTVQDVVAVLYSALKMHVTDAEINYFGESRARSVFSAYTRRVEGRSEEEKAKGPRRVDFLSKNTRFLGLTGTDDPNVWKICLGPTR